MSVIDTEAKGESAIRAGCRVVLIEDNDDGREMLAALLTATGHEVSTAADGDSGLQLVLAQQPDVAIVDIGLPGIDGYEVARQVRARSGVEHPVVLVALSGYGQPDDVRRAHAAGFDRHLVKPVDGFALAKMVSQWVPGGTMAA